VCSVETDAGGEHHCVGGFHSGCRSHWPALLGDSCSRASRPFLLDVLAGDRRPRLHDGLGQRDADQRHVAGDAPHLVELESCRTDDHRRRLVPRDEADVMVDQRDDGCLWRAVVRHRAHA